MDRKTAGLIACSIISRLLYVFGVEFYEAVWSFPTKRAVPLMVLALVGTGVYSTFKLGFPQIKYLRHGINVTRGIYDDPNDDGDLNHFRALTHYGTICHGRHWKYSRRSYCDLLWWAWCTFLDVGHCFFWNYIKICRMYIVHEIP